MWMKTQKEMENSADSQGAWSWKNRKPNNMINVVASPDKDLFKWWCVILKMFVNITPREMDVVASFLRQRFELSKTVSDPTILDTMLMSDGIKQKVREECNISLEHFYVVMSSLRRHNVIKGNILNPSIIPNIRKDDNGCFQFLMVFRERK